MQGLPVDELLLTRENEDQLADLAGNAMSTTVVGACMLAALVVGHKLLKDGSESRTYEQVREDAMVEDSPGKQGQGEDKDEDGDAFEALGRTRRWQRVRRVCGLKLKSSTSHRVLCCLHLPPCSSPCRRTI